MLHVSLDKYGFFAVTPSITTLTQLIELVMEENRAWEERMNDRINKGLTGYTGTRGFNVSLF